MREFKGAFQRIYENVQNLIEAEKRLGREISKSVNFTISPYSYRGLGKMPEVLRKLGINTISIVPFYYVTGKLGREYESIMLEKFGCRAFSWKGFHHEESGVDPDEFIREYRTFLSKLNGISCYPYLELNEAQYITWFTDAVREVKTSQCYNSEALFDIQPNGDADFCVDFPDYIIGNVKKSSIKEIWNGEKAKKFQEYRAKNLLPVCHRCGAKYMAEIKS